MSSVFHGLSIRRRLLPWAALLLLSATVGLAGAVTVTVTQQAPMESVTPAGDITGVKEGTVGAQFTLVGAAGGQVTLRDATGLYRMALSATDYVPPPVAPTPATNTPSGASAAAKSSATSNPAGLASSTVAPPAASSSSASGFSSDVSAASAGGGATIPQDKVGAVNAGLGKQVFGTQSIWSESALVIAQRLGLAIEGRTKWETSYRKYFSGDASDKEAAMLGTGAYCIALYADADDHPTSILIAFANDGDYKHVSYLEHDLDLIDHPVDGERRNYPDKTRDQLSVEISDDITSFEPTRTAEMATLVKNLSALFGDPTNATFGSDAVTRENIQRWDWGDVSFLLTGQPKKYNLLRIVPTALADNNGRTERISRDDIGAKLSGAVEHRPNGDVIITQIPMAAQGPKGYCVPATWERVLRYEGVPGDMYTLSRIGSTQFGGGTANTNIATELDDALHNYGRHCEFLTFDKLDAFSVRRYIDDGVPIFWSVNPIGYKAAEQRYALADRDKEWDRWKTLLDAANVDGAKPQEKLEFFGGHEVLIIGYNPETKEIAWTDPWGRQTTERWMTQAEAQRCSLNEYYIISW